MHRHAHRRWKTYVRGLQPHSHIGKHLIVTITIFIITINYYYYYCYYWKITNCY